MLKKLVRLYWRLRREYPVTRNSSNVYGLKYIPTISPPLYSDDWDHIFPHRLPPEEEVTSGNLKKLEEVFLAKRDHCNLIMEIGVCRNDAKSFTHVFLRNKRGRHGLFRGLTLIQNRSWTIRRSAFIPFALTREIRRRSVPRSKKSAWIKLTCYISTGGIRSMPCSMIGDMSICLRLAVW